MRAKACSAAAISRKKAIWPTNWMELACMAAAKARMEVIGMLADSLTWRHV